MKCSVRTESKEDIKKLSGINEQLILFMFYIK